MPFVKILDFGVAKMADGAQLTRTGMVLGTPAYMAPEQARGSTDVDARVDVYAVGAVLYHMLTGKPPFADDEPAVALTKVLNEDPRRPRDLERSIPEGVEALIQRAMARDPAQRPATVQELYRLLGTFDDPARLRAGSAPTSGGARARRAPGHRHARRPWPCLRRPTRLRRWRDAPAARIRPAALAWAVLYSLVAGGGVLAAAATILRVVTGRIKFTETETTLLGVAAAATLLLLLLAGTRAVISRWRSAPAVERLGADLRGALLWLVVPLTTLTLGRRGESIFGPALPPDVAPFVEIGVLALPPPVRAARVHRRPVARPPRVANNEVRQVSVGNSQARPADGSDLLPRRYVVSPRSRWPGARYAGSKATSCASCETLR